MEVSLCGPTITMRKGGQAGLTEYKRKYATEEILVSRLGQQSEEPESSDAETNGADARYRPSADEGSRCGCGGRNNGTH